MNRPKISPTTPAVVMGLGINGLGLIRSLAAGGVKVFGVYTHSQEIGRFSRYVRSFKFREVKAGEAAFVERLIDQFGNEKDRPVIFGTTDEYVMLIGSYRDTLQKYFRFSIAEQGLLKTLASKDLSSGYVVDKGLIVPETFSFSNSQAIDDFMAQVQFPLIVKPSKSFERKLNKKHIIRTEESFKKFLDEYGGQLSDVIVQRFIEGDDTCIYEPTAYVSRDGTIYPIFVMRKLRVYPSGSGPTTFGVTVEAPEIEKIARHFLDATSYRGFINMEFKRSKEGKWYYIEMNPRLPHYSSFILDAGINFPYACYLDNIGAEPDDSLFRPKKTNLHWIYFRPDFRAFIQLALKKRISVTKWFLSLFRARSFAVLDISDLLPLIVHPFYLMLTDLRKLRTAKRT